MLVTCQVLNCVLVRDLDMRVVCSGAGEVLVRTESVLTPHRQTWEMNTTLRWGDDRPLNTEQSLGPSNCEVVV